MPLPLTKPRNQEEEYRDGKGHIGRIPNDEDENDNVDGEVGGDDGGDRG